VLREPAAHFLYNSRKRSASLAKCCSSVKSGYLFALPYNVDGLVATSGFCTECWQTLPISEVERISTRVLQKNAPKGHFIDPGTSPCG
jgi:hypothetical protein